MDEFIKKQLNKTLVKKTDQEILDELKKYKECEGLLIDSSNLKSSYINTDFNTSGTGNIPSYTIYTTDNVTRYNYDVNLEYNDYTPVTERRMSEASTLAFKKEMIKQELRVEVDSNKVYGSVRVINIKLRELPSNFNGLLFNISTLDEKYKRKAVKVSAKVEEGEAIEEAKKIARSYFTDKLLQENPDLLNNYTEEGPKYNVSSFNATFTV